MPCVCEPFGIVPLEAMARDVPVIVSRQTGVSEVLRHALKVDFWDVDDMAGQDRRGAALPEPLASSCAEPGAKRSRGCAGTPSRNRRSRSTEEVGRA